MTIRSLGDLVTPAQEASFKAAFAAKTRWHSPMAMRAAVADLLPWSTIDALIAGNAIPSENFRVLLNAREMLPALYTDATNRLRPDAIQSFATQGATLAINDISRLVPAIGELAGAIERELGCATGVNAYLSFGTRSAFLAHADGHDVLAVQLQGAKLWRTFGTPVPYPAKGSHLGSPPPHEWEGLMTPGDLLYLPRGEVHAAVPQEMPSLHLTFGIVEQTGLDFIRWLATQAEDVVALRRDLGATLTGKARDTRNEEIAQAVRTLLDTAGPQAFRAHQDRQRRLRPVASFAISRRLEPESRLVTALLRQADLMVESSGDIPITLGGQPFRLPQNARRVLAAISARGSLSFGELVHATDSEMDAAALKHCVEDLASMGLIAIGI